MAEVWRAALGAPPERIELGEPGLESVLEDWIAAEPRLLGEDLRLVGRQLTLQGGRLDLLGLDPAGQLVVIEIKRGRISRSAIAQALDYAAELALMDDADLRQLVSDFLKAHGSGDDLELVDEISERQPGEREIAAIVVGVGLNADAERVVDYLSERSIPVRAVRLYLVPLKDGTFVIVREGEPLEIKPKGGLGEDERHALVIERADAAGVGGPIRALVSAAKAEGFHVRSYKRAVMVAPPAMKTHMLLTIQVRSRNTGGARLWLYPPAFSEFLGIDEPWVIKRLGPRWRGEPISKSEIESITQGLTGMMAAWQATSGQGEG